jgi:hypothetical protein
LDTLDERTQAWIMKATMPLTKKETASVIMSQLHEGWSDRCGYGIVKPRFLQQEHTMNITKRNPVKAAIIQTSTFVQRPVQASSLIALSPMRSARDCPVPFRLALQARLAQPKKSESKGLPAKRSAGAMTGAAALLVLHVGPAYAGGLSDAFENFKLVPPLLALIGAAIGVGIAKQSIDSKFEAIDSKFDTLSSGQTKLEEAIKALATQLGSNQTEIKADIRALESKLGSDIKASESKLGSDIKASESRLGADIKASESRLGSDIKASESRLGSDIKASESRLGSGQTKLGADLDELKTDLGACSA